MSLDNLDVVMASEADAFCCIGKATIAHHEQDKHGQKMEGFSEKFFFIMNLQQWLPLFATNGQDVKWNTLIYIGHYYTAIHQSCNFFWEMVILDLCFSI